MSTPPPVVRRLESSGAAELAALASTFDELQTVLLCCERLLTELSAAADGDNLAVEALWTTAMLSYGRCFAGDSPTLGDEDLNTVHPDGDALRWHRILLELRDHYGAAVANPREAFTVGVAQDDAGAACGITISSASQPRVDVTTVRQAGAIAYALSSLVDERIGARQQALLDEVRDRPPESLEQLPRVDLAVPSG